MLRAVGVLVALGTVWLSMAARADWRACGTGLAVAVVGAVAAGPARAWAVAGAGLCAVLLGRPHYLAAARMMACHG